MGYISTTEAERAQMTAAIGIASVEDLFADIPAECLLTEGLRLPAALDESAVMRRMRELAGRNKNTYDMVSFLGGGVYDHFRPAAVAALASRSEFATSYTPYQPEVSQGMLQGMYEFQTLICALTGMELANASMYDGATALAEAALMACDVTGRPDILAPDTLNPLYRSVLETYLRATAHRLVVFSAAELPQADEATACVLVQRPDFFGAVGDVAPLVEAAHEVGALSIFCVDPISLALLKSPGELGADVVVGEGQGLGIPSGFGGPLLGFFACRRRFERAFPGRIVGATTDSSGRRGYTMTLRTREQDIRRERATSNICTNEALLALAAAVYLCEMGPAGLREVAELCFHKAHYLRDRLLALPGIEEVSDTRFVKEFVIRLPRAAEAVCEALLADGILAGVPLSTLMPDRPRDLLVCVTETKTRADLDRYVEAMEAVLCSV